MPTVKTYLYAAYPINRQNSQFISVNTLLLVIPRPGILAVLKTISCRSGRGRTGVSMFITGRDLDGKGQFTVPWQKSHNGR